MTVVVVWSADHPVSRLTVAREATAAVLFHFRSVLRGHR